MRDDLARIAAAQERIAAQSAPWLRDAEAAAYARVGLTTFLRLMDGAGVSAIDVGTEKKALRLWSRADIDRAIRSYEVAPIQSLTERRAS